MGNGKSHRRQDEPPKNWKQVSSPRRSKELSKPKVTISTAGILKRKPMKEVYPKHQFRKHKKHSDEHDLFLDHHGMHAAATLYDYRAGGR